MAPSIRPCSYLVLSFAFIAVFKSLRTLINSEGAAGGEAITEYAHRKTRWGAVNMFNY